MAYNREKILKSKSAYNTLRFIHQKEKGSYPREIADNFELHPSTVSDILNVLLEVGLVDRGKRNKAQYYVIKEEGFYDLWLDLWRENLVESLDKVHELQKRQISGEESIAEIWLQHDTAKDDLTEIKQEIKENLPSLVINYSLRFLETNEEGQIKEMLKFHFHEAMERIEDEGTTEYGWLNYFANVFTRVRYHKWEFPGLKPLKDAIEMDKHQDDFDTEPVTDLLIDSL